jgi:hypothetical protein
VVAGPYLPEDHMLFRARPNHATVVAYLALFVALGGTAYAAATIGSAEVINNSLLSEDVKDATLTGGDLREGTIGSGRIADGSIIGGDIKQNTIGSLRIADNSVASADIKNFDLTGQDIAVDAIGSAHIADFSLANSDIGVLFAEVNADATVANSSGGAIGTDLGTGAYEIILEGNVSACAAVASVGAADSNAVTPGFATVADRADQENAVYVETFDADGELAALPFRLVVVC